MGTAATATGILGLSGTGAAGERPFAIEQGGECSRVQPMNWGFRSVEDFYNYVDDEDAGEADDADEGVGEEPADGDETPEEGLSGGDGTPGNQRGGGNRTQNPGDGDPETRDGQPYRANPPYAFIEQLDPNVSYLFLYEDEQGVSLVILHDVSGAEGGGGAASFRIAGLPDGGEWSVQDDPPTGDEDWNLDGDPATIHWSWDEWGTDGGVFRGLGESVQIRIEAAFNADAERYPKHPGEITDWRFLTGDAADPDAVELSTDEPVVLRDGPCS